MVLAIVVGTRPELIKMTPVVWGLEKKKIPFLLVHSGQHYDYNMSEVFFKELNLRGPDVFLEVGSASHAEQTAKVMSGVEKLVLEHGVDMLVVEGDTNTVMGGAIAGKKLGCKVVHVESGARSFDMSMPEEVNRVLTDHVSDMLFAPTVFCKKNLEREGITKNVVVSGNTELETLAFALTKKQKPFDVPKEFALVTIHRQENTTPEKLREVLALLDALPGEKVFLVHPRTRKVLVENNLAVGKRVALRDPVGYFELVWLLENCSYVSSDSGGLQKEAAALGKPLLIARENTEWVDVIESGWGCLVGTNGVAKAKSFLKFFDSNKRSSLRRLSDEKKASVIIVDVLSTVSRV